MSYIVTITSQGQISIPAKLRRKLGLDRSKKLSLREEEGKVVMEPITNLMDLAGSFKEYAIKDKPINQVIKAEKEAVGMAIVDRYQRKLKKEGDRLLVIKP